VALAALAPALLEYQPYRHLRGFPHFPLPFCQFSRPSCTWPATRKPTTNQSERQN